MKSSTILYGPKVYLGPNLGPGGQWRAEYNTKWPFSSFAANPTLYPKVSPLSPLPISMASNNILVEIIDDAVDEEFDWEAAVREIDVACQSTNPSTSNRDTLFSDSTDLCSKEKKNKPSKQSTLDKFLGNVAVAPREQSNLEYGDGDQRMPSVEVDAEAAKTWVYPVNIPVRDYQLNITKTALFQNTLVALPTGLGKTLIAAVVMYNYFRWFPDGKIVFAAPSRPLVMQQIEACHNIVGIPQEWTIDMTGQMTPAKRACFWKTKRVFFVTPQVLEKDIRSGTCLVKYLVCLVIDEAHRAMGNYAYCTVIRELMSVPVQLRILALTATPGSKRQTVQHIIDNLCVSTLEYRDENDIDVSKYVHHRRIDVIEVPVGKEAEEINDHISEVIRSYLARLSSIGLIQNRDYKTLSPVDFLNSRDMFRQRPPAELPHINPGEVEACFAALITLYHIRRLLSSHGIRPAYELLQEKLQQGSLKFLSKNESIWKAKSLMQRTISHGAPSPKLSKMLEVLNEHFETKDPKCSRVIIFSNFRGSVRDIMDALAKVGGSVKATEFIGQSSGKTLKGQSQKIQQAVLEKFRTGGYNVIVATSIGEEGLDIMEVDLVICFDANISPLRMIQRMGRTGRKHNGRVVVLACLGSEANGYKKKQASSRAITKHMRNGGKSSFNFHLSPRMIPHIFKPEVQYVEFSIEQFVSRGKKVKDDNDVHTPDFQKTLTADETDLVAKYFRPSSNNNWRLSLIAFPHCQTYPSRVHNVMHSYRTGILIDMMQHLQGLTLSRGGETFPLEDEVSSGKCIGVETVEPCKNDKEGIFIQGELEGAESLQNIADPEPSSLGTLSSMPHCHSKTPAGHSYLFGCDFVSVDAIGNIQILSLPPLSSTSLKFSKYISASNQVLLDPSVQDSFHLKTPDENYGGHAMPAEAMAEPSTLKQACTRDGARSFSVSGFCDCDVLLEEKLGGVERIIETPVSSRSDTVDLEIKESPILAAEDNNNLADTELSPRLTNLVINGIVPESPISGSGVLDNARRNLDEEFCSEQLKKSSCLQKIEMDGGDASPCRRDVPESTVCNEIQTPLLKMNLVADARGCTAASPIVEETKTPLANLTEHSYGESCHLSSGDKSANVEPVRKYKRLRKAVDREKSKDLQLEENIVFPVTNLARTFSGTNPIQNKHSRGKKKQVDNAREFIEEEAEVSSEAEVSADEEDDQDNDSYDDSFIDDRINPTAATTQAEFSGVDMMAIYRRSLLSQSPMLGHRNTSATPSPECAFSPTRISGSATSSRKTLHLHTVSRSYTESTEHLSVYKNSESFQINRKRISSDATTPCTTIETSNINAENRKRKMSFYQPGLTPGINLEKEFSFQSEAATKETNQQDQVNNNIHTNGDTVDDDQFYECLDLDAIEEQAALLLKQKSECLTQKQEIPNSQIEAQNPGALDLPSFDLGI